MVRRVWRSAWLPVLGAVGIWACYTSRRPAGAGAERVGARRGGHLGLLCPRLGYIGFVGAGVAGQRGVSERGSACVVAGAA